MTWLKRTSAARSLIYTTTSRAWPRCALIAPFLYLVAHLLLCAQMARVGMDLAVAWDNAAWGSECRKILANSQWLHTLAGVGLSVTSKKFRANEDNVQLTILPQLLARTSYDVDLACEYCRTFGIDESRAVLLAIEAVLVGGDGVRARRCCEAFCL